MMAESNLNFVLDSYQTAIAIVLPSSHPNFGTISNLRSLYDKSYQAWPPHINILYPFVNPAQLQDAVTRIREYLGRDGSNPEKVALHLNSANSFRHKDHATICLCPSQECTVFLRQLKARLLEALLINTTLEDETSYQPHLTIGQTSLDESVLYGLLDKCQRFVANERIDLEVGRLVVLQRINGEMKAVDEIMLDANNLIEGDSQENYSVVDLQSLSISSKVSCFRTYHYSPVTGTYEPFSWNSLRCSLRLPITDVVVSTYNTLVDSLFPPPVERYPKLLSSILSTLALANTRRSTTARVLCLQEVTDDFLSYLLSQSVINARFPYSTHSPTRGVLPSVRNCVTLADAPLGSPEADGDGEWIWVDFGKPHKGAVVVEIDLSSGGEFGVPIRGKESVERIVIANVHLTCGMSDGSVAAKAVQIRRLNRYFESRKEKRDKQLGIGEAWVIAGDFNIPSSLSTIESAYDSRTITQETYTTLKRGLIPTDFWTDTYHETHLSNEHSAEDLKFDGIDSRIDSHVSTLFGNPSRTRLLVSMSDGEEGATFNPLTNSLAAERVKWGANPRPQRYDRVLLHSSNLSYFQVQKTGRFGLERGSDHWGFWAHLRLLSYNTTEQGKAKQMQFLNMEADVSTEFDDKELETYIKENGMWPSLGDYMIREEAKGMLEKVLLGQLSKNTGHKETSSAEPQQAVPPDVRDTMEVPSGTFNGIRLVLQPVGSYYLNVFSPFSDLDLLCAGTISTKTFWAVARQRIKHHGSRIGIRLLRMVEAQSGIMMELEYTRTVDCSDENPSQTGSDCAIPLNLRIDLQYCQISERLLNNWPKLFLIPSSDPIFSLPIATLKKLNAYRDASYLLQTIPNLKLFRLTYRALKLWAIRKGICSARFGYLGGIHIVLLLSRIFKIIGPERIMNLTAGRVITLFLGEYANFNFEQEEIYDPEFWPAAGSRRYARSAHREPIVITTLHSPVVNVARGASKHTLQAFQDEILRAKEKLDGKCNLDSFIGQDYEKEFLNSFGNFIKIDLQYWGKDVPRGRGLVGWIESRCVLLLVELNAKFPNIYARIWPCRFISGDKEQSQDELRVFYLVGLASSIPLSSVPSSYQTPDEFKELNEQKRASFNKFMDILKSFEFILRDDEKNNGTAEYYISVTMAARDAIGDNVRSDNRTWWGQESEDSQGNFDDLEGDELSDWSDDDNEQDQETICQSTEMETPKDDNNNKRKATKGGIKVQQVILPPGAKLRPALDIMNRIKWDPEIDINDYMVGYEDRFLGIREMEMKKWKKEQTDEEFIPMHRIIYFRRKSDGKVVWDKEKKVDLLFGSGVGSREDKSTST